MPRKKEPKVEVVNQSFFLCRWCDQEVTWQYIAHDPLDKGAWALATAAEFAPIYTCEKNPDGNVHMGREYIESDMIRGLQRMRDELR